MIVCDVCIHTNDPQRIFMNAMNKTLLYNQKHYSLHVFVCLTVSHLSKSLCTWLHLFYSCIKCVRPKSFSAHNVRTPVHTGKLSVRESAIEHNEFADQTCELIDHQKLSN